jgi:DNA polymerase/3'-5' exonuclease PolX
MAKTGVKSEADLQEKRYSLPEAQKIAEEVLEELRPHCERIEIAGSIRRKKSTAGDVEIVAVAKPYATGIFEDGLAKIVNKWAKVKGELVYGLCKYTQRILPCGMKLDLFFATPENFGSIFAIRTGSADYSHKVLARGWTANGYKSEGGILIRNGEKFNVPEEKDLFRMAGVKWVPPEDRNL